MEEIEKSESDGGEQIPKKRRSLDGENDLSAVRVKLAPEIAVKAREALAELRIRGATVTVDCLLAEHLQHISDRYFEAQIDKWTPDDYYLEAAMKIESVRKRFMEQAKRTLEAQRSGNLNVDGTVSKRRRTKGRVTPSSAEPSETL